MAKDKLYKNHGVISIKYDKNYNNKFYGKYFASIRAVDFKVSEGSNYEMIIGDKIIGQAKLNHIEIIKFHEIPQFQMSMITGMNHADSLNHYWQKGLKVKDFDLKVQLLMFEMIAYVTKS